MFRAMRRVAIGSVAASLLVVAPATGAPAAPLTTGSPIIRPAYQWSMPDRFGLDHDHDGLIDLPNTEEYAHNRAAGSCPAGCGEALFDVVLDASASTATFGGEPLPIVSYRWIVRIEGRPEALEYTRAGPVLPLLLPEGDHRVSLTVTARLPWGTASGHASSRLEVEDVLIVALGDSYASGEGNPDVRRTPSAEASWADGGGDHLSEAAHAAAHRSSLAWPVQAALVLERSDPRSSVTFLTLADSGASVDDGLVAGGPGGSQVDQAARLVGQRDVDMVLLSIGGNDIGFSQLIRGLVDADRLFDPFCYSVDLANVWASVEDGDWNRDSAMDYRIDRPWQLGCRSVRSGDAPLLPGLSGLPAALDRAAAALDASLEPRAVYLTEYPDPSGFQRDGEIALCGEIVGDTTPPFRFHEIDRAEQEEGRLRALEPLNGILRDGAARHGWVYVEGVAEAFRGGHGYCADWPDYGYPDDYTSRPGFLTSRLDYPEGWYRNPGVDGMAAPDFGPGTSWYRSAAQSAVLQGPDTRYATAGTLHPNELGHRAIAEIVLNAIAEAS